MVLRQSTLLDLTIKMARSGTIVYIDKFRSCDTLVFCGYRHTRVDHKKRYSSGNVNVNGLEGFWSFPKERLINFHGVSQAKCPLYYRDGVPV